MGRDKIFFALGPRGGERVLRRRSEAAVRRWAKKHSGALGPPARWERVETGHFLNMELRGGSPIVAELCSLYLENAFNPRQLFTAADSEGWFDYPGPALLLSALAADEPSIVESPAWQEGGPFLRLLGLLRCGSAVPFGMGRTTGWLVEAPNQTVAALWELTLAAMHGLRLIRRCHGCGGAFFSRKKKSRLCPSCREKSADRKKELFRQRAPTERSKFLAYLRKLVERKKLSDEERAAVKDALNAGGIIAARKKLAEFLW